MRKTLMALLLAGLLDTCAANAAPDAPQAGVNPAPACVALPVTTYLWGPAYRNLLNSKIQPEWAYPAYVGLGTLGWAIGSIFTPVVDGLLLPFRTATPCEG